MLLAIGKPFWGVTPFTKKIETSVNDNQIEQHNTNHLGDTDQIGTL
jgi:hypothetical protein